MGPDHHARKRIIPQNIDNPPRNFNLQYDRPAFLREVGSLHSGVMDGGTETEISFTSNYR
jgi:hypothetical protein